jgi:DNA-binding IclR family transcriptional regulator
MKIQDSDDSAKNTGGGTIKSAETSLHVVEQLAELDEATLTELNQRLSFSKSTIHRHLATLTENGFAVKTDDTYRLALSYLDIGGKLRNEIHGARDIKPKIRELADKTDELAQFHVEERGYSVNIFREAGRHGVFTKVRVGKHQYMHQGSAGKAMLAHFPEERVMRILDQHGLPKATEHTIDDREGLFDELVEIRDRGFAFNIEETAKGLRTVGVPIMLPNGDVLGACVVAGPSHRMKGDRFHEEIPELIHSVVNELELNLAHR